MRIAVMGTGGIGGYFGGRLAEGGADVAFIARGKMLAALRKDGLRIKSQLGDLHLNPVVATDDPKKLGPVDLVVFGVKLWDTEEAARLIKPLVSGDTAVISFQNGVDKDDVLRGVLGDRAIIGGLSYIAATIAEPGVIAHGGTDAAAGVRRIRPSAARAGARTFWRHAGGARSTPSSATTSSARSGRNSSSSSGFLERPLQFARRSDPSARTRKRALFFSTSCARSWPSGGPRASR